MRGLKRAVDVIGSLVGLVVLSPVLALSALAIKLDHPGPVFFRQNRAGKDGRVFSVCKFRSMVVNAENQGAGVFVEVGDPRITRVGRVLRATSLDELPQLVNVLRGEMSLVGPRPTLPYQVERYDERQRRRLAVKPGMTGWAQVNGRNALTWPARIELDLWYVDNWSLWLDFRIMWRTLFVLFKKETLHVQTTDDPIAKPPSWE